MFLRKDGEGVETADFNFKAGEPSTSLFLFVQRADVLDLTIGVLFSGRDSADLTLMGSVLGAALFLLGIGVY
jgi:hypothetical protein